MLEGAAEEGLERAALGAHEVAEDERGRARDALHAVHDGDAAGGLGGGEEGVGARQRRGQGLRGRVVQLQAEEGAPGVVGGGGVDAPGRAAGRRVEDVRRPLRCDKVGLLGWVGGGVGGGGCEVAPGWWLGVG